MTLFARSFGRRNVAGLVSLSFVLLGAVVVPVTADHTFTTSAGIYRIPYIDGTAVTANNDHHNHPNVPNRVDLGAATAPRSWPRRRGSSAALSIGTATATTSETASPPTS